MIFNLGFYLWVIDGWICGFLRSARKRIGLPLAFLLELHGWYVFTHFISLSFLLRAIETHVRDGTGGIS